MKLIFVLSTLFTITIAADNYNYYYQQQTSPIPILKSDSQNDNHGAYQFRYETGHGIQAQEKGHVKNIGHKDGEIQVAQGSYSYTGPDGHSVSVNYIADENGFQVQGDHLPTPPPPKEMTETVVEHNVDQDQNQRQVQYGYLPLQQQYYKRF